MNTKLNKIDVMLFYLGESRNFLKESMRAEIGLKKVPKLGLLYIAAILKKRGLICQIFDQEIQYMPHSFLVDKIKQNRPIFIGIHCATQLKEVVLNFVKQIRENDLNVPIVVGGPGCFSKADYLIAGVNFVCHGESEVTVSELADYLMGNSIVLGSIKGISYLQGKEVVSTPPRVSIGDLDSIPFPDWELVDLKKYADLRIVNMRRPFATMITSRGCFGSCTFCSSPQMWGKPRLRSPGNVLSEIDYLVKQHQVRYIGFRDDIFGLDYSWSQEFCEGLINKKYNLIWSCQTHPFVLRNKTKERIRLFRKAGCDLLILGLQKTDPRILKAIGRDPEEPGVIKNIVLEARNAGIMTVVEFIFGLPKETEQSMQRDIDFSINIRPNYAAFYKLLLIDGSKLYDEYSTRSKSVCDLTDLNIRKYIFKAALSFYLNPAILFQNFLYFIRRPKFIPIGFLYIYNLFKNKTNNLKVPQA
jgi:anaerobic magnesium-protoporphyrin IX monomethyl ester cyclase